MSYVYRLATVAAIGGLLFGYDTAVIAGAIGFLQEKFQLSPAFTGWAVSSALLGCMFGAFFAGGVSDIIGRRKTLIISAVLFSVSAIGSAVPPNFFWFCLARIIGGIGVGAASILSPMYIAEISPSKIRGQLVTLNQLGIVVGILTVYFVNAIIAGLFTQTWNVQMGWRWMFASEALPSLLFLYLLLYIPESPRWLLQKNKVKQALKVLLDINIDPVIANKEAQSIQSSLKAENKGSLVEVLKKQYRIPLFIGLCMAMLQQVTGINAIMYYAPEIFKQAGAASSSALLQTVIVGAVNLLFTFVAIKYVDQWGRRKLLLSGSIGMCISLFVVGLAFYNPALSGKWVLIPVLTFIASFAMSFGPVTWVLLAEIFPNEVRAKAMSLSVLTLWIGVFIVSQSFPMLIASAGVSFTFWIYTGFAAISYLFVYFMVPETKGRPLESVHEVWKPKLARN